MPEYRVKAASVRADAPVWVRPLTRAGTAAGAPRGHRERGSLAVDTVIDVDDGGVQPMKHGPAPSAPVSAVVAYLQAARKVADALGSVLPSHHGPAAGVAQQGQRIGELVAPRGVGASPERSRRGSASVGAREAHPTLAEPARGLARPIGRPLGG